MQTTLTQIFIDLESVSDGLSETWGEMSRKARKFKAFFRPKLGDLQKKKKPKKKKVFAKIQSDFSAEIRNSKVFSAQNQVISKKKKKVFTQGPSRFSPELTQISSQKPDAQLTKGGAMPQFCSLYYAILQS